MTEISAELVRQLRDATNVSMMECKRALVEADGNMEKANRILRQRGLAVATKKASRAANQGVIGTATSADGRTVSLVEVNCETDFVARNQNFLGFVAKLADKACTLDNALADLVKDEVTAKVVEIGENLIVKRNARFTQTAPGMIIPYIHLGGKLGVLVELGCQKAETARLDAFKELAKELALHAAACAPRYLTSADVPAQELASERDIYAQQVKDKPAQVIDKIVDGKMKKFFAEVCFLQQGFVKEPKQSVSDLLLERGKVFGDVLTLRRYLRFQVGE